MLYKDGHFRKNLLLFFWVVLVPMRQIHMTSAELYVVLDHPRHGSHVAIPQPFGLFGMTVLVRFLQGPHYWRVEGRVQ